MHSNGSLFLLFAFLPAVFCGLDPACIVSQSNARAYMSFDFAHKTTRNTSATESVKYSRNNNMFFQLVAYDNNKFGHFVSFSEYNQSRIYTNDTLTKYVYSSVYCQSSSYKPKELNKLWVTSFSGSHPFTLEANETSKNLTASVTLKCDTPYCTIYDLVANEYSDCSSTEPKHTSIGIKAAFVVTPLYQDYAYSNLCFSQYTSSNGTYSCSYPYLSGYEYTNTNLNTTLVAVQSNTKPNKVKTLLRMNYLKGGYSSFNTFSQLYSVCGEDCQALTPEDV
jgi:hypothetical protein